MVAMLHTSAKLSKYLHTSRKKRHMWIGGIRGRNEANGANGERGEGGGGGRLLERPVNIFVVTSPKRHQKRQ